MIVLNIYYLYRAASQWRIYKITGVIFLAVVALSINYSMYNSRIIKDRNLDRYIKKEFGIEKNITEEDLRDIEELFISESYNVVSLEGIHHFKNLKKLHLWGANTITDFSPVETLDNIEKLLTWNINLDRLTEIGTIASLTELEILYPKGGKISDLESFSNLKTFYVQGTYFEGVEAFPNLKVLDFYQLHIRDISQIFALKKIRKKFLWCVGSKELFSVCPTNR